MLAGFVWVTLPKERLVIQGRRKLTGKSSLGAPVVGLAPCILSSALTDERMGRLMGRVYRVEYEPINTAQVLSILEDNDMNHG